MLILTSEVFPYRLPQEHRLLFLPDRRKEPKASFPSPLTGPYRLGGKTLANRLAARSNYDRRPPKGDPKRGIREKGHAYLTQT